jgi:hypothetical protein
MIKLIQILKEAMNFRWAATLDAKKKIIDSNWKKDGKQYKFIMQSKDARLGNINNISKEDFLELLNVTFDNPDIKIYGPKEGPNPSSKFNLYEFQTDKGLVRIILSGGANQGEKYEYGFIKALEKTAGLSFDDIENKNIVKFYKDLNINPEELTPEDIEPLGTVKTRRSISFNGPEEIGETIADVRVKDKFISIKNKDGFNIYNGGNIPFIIMKDNKVTYDPSKFDKSSILGKIFELFKIDPEKIAQGLNEYISTNGLKENKYSIFEELVNVDNTKLKNLLASAYGYGYYLKKQTKDNSISIYPVLTPKDSYELVGDVQDVEIKYPNKNTKSLTIKVYTVSDILGHIEYLIEMRNTKGDLLPLSLKIKSTR